MEREGEEKETNSGKFQKQWYDIINITARHCHNGFTERKQSLSLI